MIYRSQFARFYQNFLRTKIIETFSDTISVELQVNKIARKNRHLRVFSKKELVKIHALDLWKGVLKPAKKLKDTRAYEKLASVYAVITHSLAELIPSSPKKKLLFQASLISTLALVSTSLTQTATFTSAYVSYNTEYIDAYAVNGDILVSDEDGYLVKINPQTHDSNRAGLSDYAVHTVESGESLSYIAEYYDVNVKTIMWENGLSNANSLRIGQKLLIPPVNGISYKVKSGDTLEKIAETYKIETDSIIAQNGLNNDILAKGQSIFLPGAEPIIPINTLASNYRVSAGRDTRYTNVTSSDAVPTVGKIFIFPTVGKISQGYRAGHYAIDIADTSMPPVWAAGSGTVTKASSGTWGGGYGNHIIIDHGDGMETLYAHLDSLNVYEGQEVTQGDVIGIMGNTGRVYGATGIHLHWEVIDNGVKRNPYNYY